VTFVEDNEIIAKMEWSKSYPGVPFDPYNDFNEISKSFPDWKNIIKKYKKIFKNVGMRPDF